MILCSNPKAQYLAHQSEIERAIQRVLNSGYYIRGNECSSFEIEFSKWLGTKYSIGVANGTEALWLSLLALGIKAGDEVISVSQTAVATIAAIELTGATPVFADIDAKTMTLCPESLKKAISPKTKAVIAVHLYGISADITAIQSICKDKGLFFIEDCAQAHGATWNGKKVGTYGDLSCFSFYPTKNLGAIGDGGAIATNSKSLYEKCCALREYGWKERYTSEFAGANSRLDELQAAILRVKLPHLDSDNEKRAQIAARYEQGIGTLPVILPMPRKKERHVYHLYVLKTQDRDSMKDALNARGVGAAIHYPLPVHLQPAYRSRISLRTPLPITEKIAKEILTLPMYPELTQSEISTVIESFADCLEKKAA